MTTTANYRRTAGGGTPPVGTVIQGRYRILGPLGEGGMGTVYRAERIGLGRPVAIKFLHSAAARDPQFVKRFEVEAQAMSRLSHPHCVSVLDFGVQTLPFLVMDLVDGESLRSVLSRGRLPPARAVAIARQILAGLAHAHGQSVIHRDVKPENILLAKTTDGRDHVKLVDFGLAKLRDSTNPITVGLTLGTPQYMAPEQMREGPIDERVDIYTVGLVMYEMLTGVKAFDGTDVGEILLKQHQTQPAPFRVAAPDLTVPTALEAVVRRALAKAPSERFASVAEMLAAIDQASDPVDWARAATVPRSLATGQPRRPDPGRRAERLAVTVGRRLRLMVGVARRQRRRRAAELVALARKHPRAAAGAGAGLALVLVVFASMGGDEAPPARPTRPPVAAPRAKALAAHPPAAAPAPRPPASSKLAGIEAFLARGERERAIALVRELRSADPADADYAAILARLAFEQRRWAEGLSAFRTAQRHDPQRRADGVLINLTIDSLQNEATTRTAEELLLSLGEGAKPHVLAAATNHPMPRVRGRARALVRDWDRARRR